MGFTWFKKRIAPDRQAGYWQRYLTQASGPIPGNTGLDEVSFVAFDTETTGLNARRDRLLALGAVKIQGRRIEAGKSLELFVQQEYQAEKSSVEIHGILPVLRSGSLSEDEALPLFLDYIGNSVLIGHHVRFDRAVINAVLMKRTGGRLQNFCLDTAQMAHRLLSPYAHFNPGDLSLDQLCRRFDIPLNDRHTAAGDAFLTALLFLKLLNRLEQRGVGTWRELRRR